MAQLSFWVTFDEARKEYIDTGAWCDLDDGNIYLTKNFRPLKSLKYVKAEDSVFGAADVPSMAVYPGEINPRVRWDGASLRGLNDGDYEKIRSLAVPSVSTELKSIKNKLQNAMASPILYELVAFSKIGKCEDGTALKTRNGDTVLLEDFPELEPTVARLEILPNAKLTENGVMLCGFWFNGEKRRISAQPLCIIPYSKNIVVRLLY